MNTNQKQILADRTRVAGTTTPAEGLKALDPDVYVLRIQLIAGRIGKEGEPPRQPMELAVERQFTAKQDWQSSEDGQDLLIQAGGQALGQLIHAFREAQMEAGQFDQGNPKDTKRTIQGETK